MQLDWASIFVAVSFHGRTDSDSSKFTIFMHVFCQQPNVLVRRYLNFLSAGVPHVKIIFQVLIFFGYNVTQVILSRPSIDVSHANT